MSVKKGDDNEEARGSGHIINGEALPAGSPETAELSSASPVTGPDEPTGPISLDKLAEIKRLEKSIRNDIAREKNKAVKFITDLQANNSLDAALDWHEKNIHRATGVPKKFDLWEKAFRKRWSLATDDKAPKDQQALYS